MQRWRRLLVVAMAVCASTAVVVANRPQALSLENATGFVQGNYVVDKQSWWLDGTRRDPAHIVVNPLSGCSWDINDHSNFSASGTLAAGAAAALANCHVFDTNPIYSCFAGACAWRSGSSNWAGFRIDASSSGLLVTLCFQPQARCFTANPVYDATAKLFVYTVCAQALYDPGDPAITPIDGSNGGLGAITTITRSVSNPTTSAAKTVWARWGLTSDLATAPGCPAFPSPVQSGSSTWPMQSAYPWYWVSS